MSARDLFGAIAKHHGCRCKSCVATHGYLDAASGFAAWPRGDAATPAEARKLYAVHTAFAWKDARKRAMVSTEPASFYGIPAGLTRSQVESVLAATFQEVSP